MRHLRKTVTAFTLSVIALTRALYVYMARTAQQIGIRMAEWVLFASKRPICLISMMSMCGGLRTDKVRYFFQSNYYAGSLAPEASVE